MNRKMLRPLSLTLIMITSLIAFRGTAMAGPPLICRPFEIGSAASLPWNGTQWRSVKADYAIDRLVPDTLALLKPETPIIVRMETLRRAVIYAVWSMGDKEVNYQVRDLKVANELLSRLMDQARTAKNPQAEALALFDAGYFVEACKQSARHTREGANFASNLDGYAWITKALELSGGQPEIEFAAAIITMEPRRPAYREHMRKAVAKAKDDSPLARNLVNRFDDTGKTLSELRANLRIAKN